MPEREADRDHRMPGEGSGRVGKNPFASVEIVFYGCLARVVLDQGRKSGHVAPAGFTMSRSYTRRLYLETLENRLAPAAHSLGDPETPTDAGQYRAASTGEESGSTPVSYAENASVVPLVAAAVVIGLCVAWDRKSERLTRHGHSHAH